MYCSDVSDVLFFSNLMDFFGKLCFGKLQTVALQNFWSKINWYPKLENSPFSLDSRFQTSNEITGFWMGPNTSASRNPLFCFWGSRGKICFPYTRAMPTMATPPMDVDFALSIMLIGSVAFSQLQIDPISEGLHQDFQQLVYLSMIVCHFFTRCAVMRKYSGLSWHCSTSSIPRTLISNAPFFHSAFRVTFGVVSWCVVVCVGWQFGLRFFLGSTEWIYLHLHGCSPGNRLQRLLELLCVLACSICRLWGLTIRVLPSQTLMLSWSFF